MLSKKQKSRKSWRPDEEELLVEIWADKIGQLRGVRKNSHVFKEMAVLMKEHSPEEIKIKIHNLTNRYNKEKKLIGPSGGSPSEWKLYTKVHAILGGLPIHNISELVEESVAEPQGSQSSAMVAADSDETEDIEEILLSISDNSGPSSSSVSIPSAAKNKRKISKSEKECNKLDVIISENLKMIQKTDEQLLEVEKERNAILERIATSCEVVQQEIVSRLKSN